MRRLRPVRETHTPRHVSANRTHVGRVRSLNEDRLLDASPLPFWAVADGMGGHRGGDVAAEILVEALGMVVGSIDDDRLADAFARANERIFRGGGGESGTTVVTLDLRGDIATVRWAGDSRAYLVRKGELRQLTHDHSVVQELVDAGLIRPEQAAGHPHANVITRALGTAPQVAIEYMALEVKPGDRLLLCSDGLSRSLSARDFTGPLLQLEAQADRLLTNALQRDGSDNISLVLVEIA